MTARALLLRSSFPELGLAHRRKLIVAKKKMRSATILIAEDERTARTSLAGLLEAEGFRVLTAENGIEALSLLLSEEPEAAILDIRMPEMDGLTVLRRAREGGSDSALIVMTAHGDSGTAIDAMKLGAFDYV